MVLLGSGARGVIYVGDSVGAHFHVPPMWFSPLEMSSQLFVNITDVVSREADWPDLGFATGWEIVFLLLLHQKKHNYLKSLCGLTPLPLLPESTF